MTLLAKKATRQVLENDSWNKSLSTILERMFTVWMNVTLQSIMDF